MNENPVELCVFVLKEDISKYGKGGIFLTCIYYFLVLKVQLI